MNVRTEQCRLCAGVYAYVYNNTFNQNNCNFLFIINVSPQPPYPPHLIRAAAGSEQRVDEGGCRPGQLDEEVQGRAAVLVDAVGVCAGPQQRHDALLVAPRRRLEQGRREHGGRDLAAHSPPQQLRQTAAVAVTDRLHDAATGNDVFYSSPIDDDF